MTTNITLFSPLTFRFSWLSIIRIIDIDGRSFFFWSQLLVFVLAFLIRSWSFFLLSPLASYLFLLLATVLVLFFLFAFTLFHASSQIPFGVTRCLILLLANFFGAILLVSYSLFFCWTSFSSLLAFISSSIKLSFFVVYKN